MERKKNSKYGINQGIQFRKTRLKEKHKKFYMMFDKRFKNLILFSNLNSDCGIKKDFF